MEKVAGWRIAVEEAFRRHDVKEERQKLDLIPDLLTDRAARWWRDECLQHRADIYTSADDLMDAIVRRFTPFGDWRRLFDKWCRLRHNDSFVAYWSYVEQLQAVFPQGNDVEVRFAMRGMKEGLQVDVMCRMAQEGVERPKLQQVLDWAEQLAPKHRDAPAARSSAATVRPPTVNAIEDGDVEESEINIATICFACEKNGHPAFKCPDRKPKGCYRCGNTTHRIRDCPDIAKLKERLAKANPAIAAIIDPFLELHQPSPATSEPAEEVKAAAVAADDET